MSKQSGGLLAGVIQRLYEVHHEVWELNREHFWQLNPLDYLKDHCTLRVQLGRACGHTRAASVIGRIVGPPEKVFYFSDSERNLRQIFSEMGENYDHYVRENGFNPDPSKVDFRLIDSVVVDPFSNLTGKQIRSLYNAMAKVVFPGQDITIYAIG